MMHIENRWRPSLEAKNQNMFAWLSHKGSFIHRLEQHGITYPTIDVLREGWFEPEPWESELLKLKSKELAWVREVCIFNNINIWLYGRTVIPKEMLKGKRELACLENRSLGSVLFQDPNIKRNDFEFIHIEPGQLWQHFLSIKHHEASWVRRSLFNLYDRSLLLSEILMPDLKTLCMKK